MLDSYDSLEQRMVQTYVDTFPPFVAAEDGPTTPEQEEFYRLMEGLYGLLYAEPQLLVRQLHEDDAYPNRFNRTSYGKPKLNQDMRRATKAIDSLLDAMLAMAREPGAAKLSRMQRVIFDRLGVDPTGPLPTAWVWMATREGSSRLAFSRCLFREGYPYAGAIYARSLGNEDAFQRLERWLVDRGYTRFDYLNGSMSMDYANLALDQQPPRGGYNYKIRHTGVSLAYDDYVAKPAVLGLCIPGGMKAFLEAFDSADTRVREFMLKRTKKCDGCRYCVQTDKTGTRPLAQIAVRHGGTTYRLCPYFPGYRYCWTRLDDELLDDLIGMLDFMDGCLPARSGRA